MDTAKQIVSKLEFKIKRMYYKISNTAGRKVLEEALSRPLKYPLLHEKKVMINGMDEATIPIVAMHGKGKITPAIWGLLPNGYKEDWSIFQNLCNTLNIPFEAMSNNSWHSSSLAEKRCLIPITGFYTSYVQNGIVYPSLVSKTNGKPFCLAGIYSILEDGFLTCSIITCKADKLIQDVHNIGHTMPKILSGKLESVWLEEGLDDSDIKQIMLTPHDCEMRSHAVARELYHNTISYDSIQDPFFTIIYPLLSFKN